MRANLWLRTASRVLVRTGRFRATAFHELERQAKRIPWEAYLAPGGQAEFRVTARKSRLYHTEAIAERLKRAAGSPDRPGRGEAGRTRAPRDPRPDNAPSQLFVVRVVRDEFEISADSSGDLLHVRGYRQAVAKAPLRETLAAALLLAADWRGDEPLLDPFCGSGTIPIEAALLARRIPPGLRRNFAFMRWPRHDAGTWGALIAEARAGMLSRAPAPILGSDRDAGAIEAARANAERADVGADLTLLRRAVSAIEPPGQPGLIATNPPYGVRLRGAGDARNVYAQLGKVLRHCCARWRVALYAPEAKLAAAMGLSLGETLRTSNGGIRVSAYLGVVDGGRV